MRLRRVEGEQPPFGHFTDDDTGYSATVRPDDDGGYWVELAGTQRFTRLEFSTDAVGELLASTAIEIVATVERDNYGEDDSAPEDRAGHGDSDQHPGQVHSD